MLAACCCVSAAARREMDVYIETAAVAVEAIIARGLDADMNEFNQK